MASESEYEVALSFAGEQRPYVEEVATLLRAQGVRVFYDDFERAKLWGKDLYEHLDYIYGRAAKYCVVFISSEYAEKIWTTHERKSAQARAISENEEYILPARFDDTEVPGLRSTLGLIDLRTTSPEELASLIVAKLGPRRSSNFFPPEPDLLYERLGVTDPVYQEFARDIALEFYRSLVRMSELERRVLFQACMDGCHGDMPENIHVSIDLIRRPLGMASAEVVETLQGMQSLGISLDPHPSDDHDADDIMEIRWTNFVGYEDERKEDFSTEMSTAIAYEVVTGAAEDNCMTCALEGLNALDFSALSSVLATEGHRV